MVLTIWPWYCVCWIIQKSHNCIFEWSKQPKMRFFAIFWSLVCWIDLILHIVIVLNVFQLWAKLPADEGSLKDNKIAFLNDPKGQKRFFTVIAGGRRSAIVNTCFPRIKKRFDWKEGLTLSHLQLLVKVCGEVGLYALHFWASLHTEISKSLFCSWFEELSS